MKLADVFVTPPKSLTMPTTPGRSVRFLGGHAVVTDQRDMPHVLAMPDAKVIPTADGMSWAGEWLGQTREIKATVEWPDGYKVDHANQDEWAIYRPDNEAHLVLGPEGQPPADTPTADSPSPLDGAGLMNLLLGQPTVEPQPPVKERKAASRKRKAA